MKKHNRILLIVAVALFTLSVIPITALSSEIIIITSSDIIPYQKAIEGFKGRLPQDAFQEYSINEDIKSQGQSVVERALKRGGDIILAVGPQATYLIGNHSSSVPKVFTMVLNPEKLLNKNNIFPGVSLNLPIALQLEMMKLGFPGRKRIGAFYNQKLNQKTIDDTTGKALNKDLFIVGLPIASQKEIPEILNSPQFNIDILWIIPDRTVGSEKILKYLIKNMLLKNIPVVGFNDWFTENGAILSFSLDYQQIGRKTAELAQRILREKNSPEPLIQEPSTVKTIVNLKIARKLNIFISSELIQNASEVIQ